MALDHAHGEALLCGTLMDDLIAQITDGAAPLDRAHQAACRYCQAALDAIRAAWVKLQALVRAPVAIPEELGDRIVEQVRELARTSEAAVVIADVAGETRIGDVVLARLARAAALPVTGVALATTTHAGEDPQRPGSAVIALRLVVQFGPAIEQIAARVRERVIADVRARAGIAVTRVDVAVEDLLSP